MTTQHAGRGARAAAQGCRTASPRGCAGERSPGDQARGVRRARLVRRGALGDDDAPGADLAAAGAARGGARPGRPRAGPPRAGAHGGGPPGPSRAAERRRRAAGADCDPGRVPDRGGAARVDDPPARVGHRQRNRRGSLRAAGHPRALQRDQRMGQDRDPARGGGAAVRRRAAARVRAAGARRRPPGRGGASADRARGRAGDARPPEASRTCRACCCSRCWRSSCGASGCRPTVAAGCCSPARRRARSDGRSPLRSTSTRPGSTTRR